MCAIAYVLRPQATDLPLTCPPSSHLELLHVLARLLRLLRLLRLNRLRLRRRCAHRALGSAPALGGRAAHLRRRHHGTPVSRISVTSSVSRLCHTPHNNRRALCPPPLPPPRSTGQRVVRLRSLLPPTAPSCRPTPAWHRTNSSPSRLIPSPALAAPHPRLRRLQLLQPLIGHGDHLRAGRRGHIHG